MSKRRDRAAKKVRAQTAPKPKEVPSPRTPPTPPNHGFSKRLVVIVAVVAVLAVLGLAAFWTGYFAPSSSSSSQVFSMDGTSQNFSGSAASAFEIVATNSCTDFVCGSAPVGGSITVLDEISPSTYSCTDLGQYEVSQVTASASGAFVITSVRAFASTTGVNTPLPVTTPWANQTSCVGVVGLFVTVKVVDRGPTSQMLYLTEDVEVVH